jgi:F420H(2)-dependent quinone reductase
MARGTARGRAHPTRPRLRVVNAFTCWVLRTPALRRLADHQVAELQFTGTRTGRLVRLPVMYAQRGDQLVILVGGPERKRWWRNFTRPHPVRVLLRGVPRTGIGHVVGVGRAEAADIYAARFPELPVGHDPMVLITLDPQN